MSGLYGVKESMELMEGLSKLVDIASEVMKDGKISIGDITALPGLIAGLKPALEGVVDVKKELTELDSEELRQVVSAFADLVVKISEKFA